MYGCLNLLTLIFELGSFNVHLMNYELKILFNILFLKPLRLFISLMKLGKELKIFAPRKAKALCPLVSLHSGNER